MNRIIAVVALIALSAQVSAAPAYVQSRGQDPGGSGTGTTFAFSSSVTSGNLLVYGVRLGGDTTVTVTSTCTTGSWTEAIHSAPQGDDSSVLSLSYAIATSSGSCTITYTFGTSVTSRYAIAEYSGIDTSSPLDKVTSNQSGGSTSTSPATTSAQTPSQAESLVLGLLTTGNNSTITAGSGYTLRQATDTSNRFALEDKVLASASAQTAAFSLASAQTYIAGLAIFKGAGGGGGGGSTVVNPITGLGGAAANPITR